MIRPLALAATLALPILSGCLPRLTDPVYAFKPLRAAEPAVEGQTLIFGTIEFEPGWIGPDGYLEIDLQRVRPGTEDFFRILATQVMDFRAFRPRRVKDGHFLGAVEPGAYELLRLVGNDLARSAIELDEDGRRASRFTVTRPGIIDLGAFYLKRGFLGSSFTMIRIPRDERPERLAVLREAVKGTHWERYLGGGGDR
ncbi:MAG TPA: hypothetical protein VLT61_00425 [Anaeromyxobacteraceae bacterium]|nr:hypothetical protein [Anaeromyxobacteraceae bacterium]